MTTRQQVKLQLNLTPTPSQRRLPTGVARIYEVGLFKPGTHNGWTFSADVVQASLPKWAADTMLDHAGFFSSPSTSRLVGMTRNARREGNGLAGELHILTLKQAQQAIELLDLIVQMREAGEPAPKVGMSADMYLTWEDRDGERIVTSIDEISTVDIVVHPAATDPVRKILLQQEGPTMNNEETPTTPVTTPAPTPVQMAVQPADVHDAVNQALREADAQLATQCNQLLNVRLSAAGLPSSLADLVRARFQDEGGVTRIFQPAELEAEITRAKAAHAQMSAQAAVRDMGQPVQDGRRRAHASGMYDSGDRIHAAYERLMGLPVAAQFSDVPHLTGIRELYVGLTGDRDMRGVYQPEHVQFAVSGATTPMTAAVLANITADVMNKLALQSWSEWSAAGYGWYRRAAKPQNFSSLKDAKFIVLGGVANLSTVNEGAVYGELAVDDKKEQFAFVKKGGYLPLTIEAIDKDDTESWRSVGVKLGISAIRTLSADMAALLTANAAIDEDSKAWFHADHNNLLGQDIDGAGWDAAGTLIYEQTEVNSSKTLAIWPDRVIVPVQKRRMALKLFFGDKEPGGVLGELNVAALDGTKDSDGPVIVCPELTDHEDWYALCNPQLQPVMGIGYRFGDRPEIFSAADPTSFLMFYQDCLAVKVRWFYAAGVVDYRGIAKSEL